MREDARLWEQDFGDWDGRPYADLPDIGNLDRAALADHRPKGGESFADMVARVAPALREAGRQAREADAPIAVVAHAGTVRAGLALATGDMPGALAFEVGHLSATRLRCLADRDLFGHHGQRGIGMSGTALASVRQARVAGHFGEWMQGRLGPDGPVALVTLPCPALGVTALAERSAFGVDGVVPEAAARVFFEALGGVPAMRFRILADAVPGGGAGVSTAALLAMAKVAGGTGDLARAALAAEGAVDPLMLERPGDVLWASREARVVEVLGPTPEVEIAGGFFGAPQRTEAADIGFPDITDLVEFWRGAVAREDRAALAGIATEAARRTTAQRGPQSDPTEDLAHELGALGWLRAHTGSARGLIFAPGKVPDGIAARLAEAGLTDPSGVPRMNFAAAMLVALAIDAAIGWPEALYRRIGHPVGWIGAAIAAGERRVNEGDDRTRLIMGALLALLVIGTVAMVAVIVSEFLPAGLPGILATGLLAWPFVAARSLHEHVADVANPLARSDVAAARTAVSRIVGRNPETLDEPAMARASLESLAENASDGVVAPLFWGALLGLPGIAAYKAVNTLDSMIGYRNDRYRHFGKAAARIDDLANLIPARLTGALISAGAKARGTAFRTMLRDARSHRSPNAGWPEAAMAGALGIRLSGPRVYDGVPTDDPWLNPVGFDPRPEDVVRGLEIYRRAVALMALFLLVWAVV